MGKRGTLYDALPRPPTRARAVRRNGAAPPLLLARLVRLEQEVASLRRLLTGDPPPHPREASAVRPADPPPCGAGAPAVPPAAGTIAEETHWEVTWLGGFRLTCNGRQPPPCRIRRGRSVLMYLLLSPSHATAADVLAECFWPETPAAVGGHRLQMAVHALRQSLRGCGPDGGDQAVLLCEGRYRLHPALHITQDVETVRAIVRRGEQAQRAGQPDAARGAYEEARRVLAAEFLAGEPDEPWATGQRAAVEDLRLTLLDRLGALHSRSGDWLAAAGCARDVLAVDPYREDACRRLMRAYAAAGRAGDAARAYADCAAALKRDLRLTPAAETVALYRALCRGELPAAP